MFLDSSSLENSYHYESHHSESHHSDESHHRKPHLLVAGLSVAALLLGAQQLPVLIIGAATGPAEQGALPRPAPVPALCSAPGGRGSPL